MARKKNGELVPVNLDYPTIGDYMVTKASTDAMAIIRENMGNREVSAFDLDRVKFPSSGGIAWEVPTLDGSDITKEIVGIIIYKRRGRVYYDAPYDGTLQPPKCSSPDGEIGQGDPGGFCKSCPMSQWGSARGADGAAERGQACSERELLFILRKNDVLPIIISIPPTSLRISTQYALRLASQATRYWHVTTRLELVKVQNANGIPYSQLKLSIISTLNPQEVKKIAAIVKSYQDVFAAVPIESATE